MSRAAPPAPPGAEAAEANVGPAWELRGWRLSLHHPLVMGILNVTPDSFSDGGRLPSPEAALRRARELAEAGADLLDVGGESTRPGAAEVSQAEELRRVLPVVRLLTSKLGLPVSVDTRKAAVARAALNEGAAAVNDVSGLDDPEMAQAIASAGAGAVLMHMRGTPATMRSLARYRDVGEEVAAELGGALGRARIAGIPEAAIILDPGLGFAKTADHNLHLLRDLRPLLALGRPILLGPSRKAFLGELLDGAPPGERDVATAAACALGYAAGARLFRVHDVRAARDALRVAHAVCGGGRA